MATATLLCYNRPPFFPSIKAFNSRPQLLLFNRTRTISFRTIIWPSKQQQYEAIEFGGRVEATRRKSSGGATTEAPISEEDGNVRRFLQLILWAAEGVYILWLFLLPYAPVCAQLILLFSHFFLDYYADELIICINSNKQNRFLSCHYLIVPKQ